MTDAHLYDHIVFALLGVVFPVLAIVNQKRSLTKIDYDTPTKISMYWSNGLILWAMVAVVGALWWFSERSFGDLGLRTPAASPWTPLLAGIVVVGYVIEGMRRLCTPERRSQKRAYWLEKTPFLPSTQREAAHFAFLALSAGFCEELVFRGYLLSYLRAVLGDSTWALTVAVTLPAVVFSLSHLYQGWVAVTQILVLSLSFGLIFVLSGSLVVPIVLHLLLDVVGGYLAAWVTGGGDVDAPNGADVT